MKKLLIAGCLVSICVASCVLLRAWEVRFDAEFRLHEVSAHTPRYHIPVRFPRWLRGSEQEVKADRESLLDGVDAYWDLMRKHYPWVIENFDPRLYPIYLHDAVGAFVAGTETSRVWASGWAHGHTMIVAWSWKLDISREPDGMAEKDPIGSLCHEWFHPILEQRYGWGEPGHSFKFKHILPTPSLRRKIRRAAQQGLEPRIPMSELRKTLAQMAVNAPRVRLSELTQKRALGYRYIPWCVPGRR